MENRIISLLRLGSYKNASEYFMLLVQQDKQRQTKQRLETKLIQGIESGTAEPMTAQDWDEICQAMRERSVERS
ncbi:MAG: type II toxin-antitoxin system ParD family antitoxin [Okeania sp. SIO3C4]|nr:type II toxin-antitoxin system ParD family antitoxin [Okeania sp. SIO3C4]